MPEQIYREKFLLAFTYSLIETASQILPKESIRPIRQVIAENSSPPEKKHLIKQIQPLNSPPVPIPKPIRLPQLPPRTPQEPNISPGTPKSDSYMLLQEIPALSKIIGVLQDQEVQVIECPGPGKNVVAIKNGATQNTGITYSQQEIQDMITDLSKKTKIPIVGGFFKAALGPAIITFLHSEYIGSRFILQKKRRPGRAPGQFY